MTVPLRRTRALSLCVDYAALDQTTGNVASRLGLEDLAYFGFASDNFFELGLEHANDGCFDVLDDLVDDLVGANLDTLLICNRSHTTIRSGVEGNNRCTSSLGQCDVAFGWWTNGLVQEVDLDLGSFETGQAVGQCFERTMRIGTDDEFELGSFADLNIAEQILELCTTSATSAFTGHAGHSAVMRPSVGDLACSLFVLSNSGLVAGSGNIVGTQSLYRH